MEMQCCLLARVLVVAGGFGWRLDARRAVYGAAGLAVLLVLALALACSGWVLWRVLRLHAVVLHCAVWA